VDNFVALAVVELVILLVCPTLSLFFQHGCHDRKLAKASLKTNESFANQCEALAKEFMSDVTRILDRVQQGDPKAAEELMPLVYEELRKLAAHKMANEAAGHTLQPTALVHEAWVRLVQTPDQVWQNRAHFFRTAAECMRHILIDHARRKQQVRHGGGQERI